MSRELAISALSARLSGSFSLPAGHHGRAGFSVVVQRLWGTEWAMNKWQ